MKNVRINYTLVGGFVLAMLASLIVVVALLTGRTGRSDSYTTELPNVAGVKFGTKVTYEGFVVGQVEDIEPRREDGITRFVLTLSVRQGWPIPADSVVRITAAGILSAMVVDIKGGTSQAMLPPGSAIPGAPAAHVFALMNEMAGQVAQLNQQGLMPLVTTLNQRIDNLGRLLEAQAPELLANLLTISQDLAVKTPRITADVQKMTTTLSSQVVTSENAGKINETLANMAQLSAGLKDSRGKLDAVLTGLDKTIEGNRGTVEASLKDLRYTLQAVARHIDSLTYNLEGTSRNLHEFSRQIRDNPGVLIGGNRPAADGPGRQ